MMVQALKVTFHNAWRQVKRTGRKVASFLLHDCEAEDVLVVGLVVILL